MTLKEAILKLSDAKVPNPAYDAGLIFSEIGKIPRHLLPLASIETDSEAVTEAIERRCKREPLQYILGRVDFYRESYYVTPDVLIPRSDTELLVDYGVKNIPSGASFIDLCTGSGCVAISILNNTKNTTATALDISDKALDVARKNAKNAGVENRLNFLCKDALIPPTSQKVFAVLSNPPYVANDVYSHLEPEIYYEPKLAFVGGVDGGDFYRAITANYKNLICDDGFIAYEIGYDQTELLKGIALDNGLSIEIIHDLSNNPRVAVLRNK